MEGGYPSEAESQRMLPEDYDHPINRGMAAADQRLGTVTRAEANCASLATERSITERAAGISDRSGDIEVRLQKLLDVIRRRAVKPCPPSEASKDPEAPTIMRTLGVAECKLDRALTLLSELEELV